MPITKYIISNNPKHEYNPFPKKKQINKISYIQKGLFNQHSIIITQTLPNQTINQHILYHLNQLLNLSTAAQQLLIFILNNTKQNSEFITISRKSVLNHINYKSNTTLYRALGELIHHNILARSTNEDEYFMNPSILFQYNELSICYRYISSDTTSVSNDKKNQEPIEGLPEGFDESEFIG